jgi:uncharacterized membrane protein
MHQILQWHHLVSSHVPPSSLANLEINTLADGLFHAVAWLVSLVGVALLWRASHAGAGLDASHFVGGLLAGWGGFNLVEGVVDHQVLGIHHVRPGPDELLYDAAYLVWGASMLIAGIVFVRRRTGS